MQTASALAQCVNQCLSCCTEQLTANYPGFRNSPLVPRNLFTQVILLDKKGWMDGKEDAVSQGVGVGTQIHNEMHWTRTHYYHAFSVMVHMEQRYSIMASAFVYVLNERP